MKNKKALLVLFILISLIQLSVPAKMIYDKENIIKEGVALKFKTAPVDPYDPFRGKYISLRYSNNTIEVEKEQEWERNEQVYVTFEEGKEGFVQIHSLSHEKPENTEVYLETTIDHVTESEDKKKVTINYPFDRYYMEESKAYEAEISYNESLKDSTIQTFARVFVKNGQAVLKDVVIDGVSIKEYVIERRREEKEE